MKIKPLLTEKSLNLAKIGQYTFVVDSGLVKEEITGLINEANGVHVKSIKTMNYKVGKRKNYKGRIISVKAFKKAVVVLEKDEKIDAFDTKKKGKSK